jgi:tetratricopeptide (TPR) repeat protein
MQNFEEADAIEYEDLFNIACIYLGKSDFAKAEELLLKAESMCLKFISNDFVIVSLTLMSPPEICQEAFESSGDYDLVNELATIHIQLGIVHAKQFNFGEASQYFQKVAFSG